MTTADIITKTVKSAFPDSPTTQKYYVMLGILTMPHSNATYERICSCVRNNKTDQRASLAADTVDSLLVLKLAPGEPYQRQYTAVQLQKLKSAYHQSLKSQ